MKFTKINNNIQIEDLIKVNKYPYKRYNRFSDEKGRKYLVQEQKVPSVTTILGKTKSEKDSAGLQAWRNRVGEAKAREITQNAAAVGEEMHYILENYFNGTPYYNPNPSGQQPRIMAHKILENLTPITEVWGNEISLAYQHEYAGTTDMIVLYDGKPTIVDFKQSNRPKKDEYVEDYKHQLGAYYLAHKEHYGPIEQGLISVCVRDLTYQQWLLKEADLQEYAEKFMERVEQFKKLII